MTVTANAPCYFLCFIVEATIIWEYASHLFSARHKPSVRLVWLIILYAILFLVSLMENSWLNVALYFFLNLIFFLSMYSSKWYAAIFYDTILTAIMCASELVAYGIIRFFSPSFSETNNSVLSTFIFAIINKLIFFIVSYSLILVLKPQDKNRPSSILSTFLLILIPITSLFVALTFVSIGASCTFPASTNRKIILSAVFLLADSLLVFGIYQYQRSRQAEFTEMQLLLQKEADLTEYYEMLRTQNENQRILIHDIKKHLQVIAFFNEKKDCEEIDRYLRQLACSSDLKESARMCNHEMLNSLLCHYASQCSDRGIAFHADVRNGTCDFIPNADLTSLFGNLLDNAVTAACGMTEPFVELCVSRRAQTSFIVITVLNSCRCDPFAAQGGLPASAKKNPRGHGFGLKSIRKTIARYNGDMQMYFDESTHTFHTIIVLKQK